MGATLPIVMRSALVRDRAVGSRIGLALRHQHRRRDRRRARRRLLFRRPTSASPRRFALPRATNLAIGVVAIAASYASTREAGVSPGSTDEAAPPRSQRVEPAPRARSAWTVAPRLAVLWTFVLSGVLSLALEIVWFRMLVIVPASDRVRVHDHAGGRARRHRARQRHCDTVPGPPAAGQSGLAVLTVVQLAISVAAVLVVQRARVAADGWSSGSRRPSPSWVSIPTWRRSSSPACWRCCRRRCCSGLRFRWVCRSGPGDDQDSARRIGTFYSLNVCGAIAGSVLGGFVLLPLLGSRGSLIAAASLAAAVERHARDAAVAHAPQLRRLHGRRRTDRVRDVRAQCRRSVRDCRRAAASRRARHLARGRRADHGRRSRAAARAGSASRILYLDGMHQAERPPVDGVRAPPHRRAAGACCIPRPRTALVVGLGGGATAGRRRARSPACDVDVVELSSAVVDGAAFFRHINFDLLQRPNVHLRVDDGRNYLLTTRKKYDVVTADIILPRHAGAGALYSREYFELVRERAHRGRARAAVERRGDRHAVQADPAHVPVGVSVHDVVGRRHADGRAA